MKKFVTFDKHLLKNLLFAAIALSLPFTLLLKHHVTQLRLQVQKHEILLKDMREIALSIESLQKSSQDDKQSLAQLPATIQQTISHDVISGTLTHIQQTQNNTYKLHFEKVNFDNFLKWLITYQKAPWTVVEIQITQKDAFGTVTVDVELG